MKPKELITLYEWNVYNEIIQELRQDAKYLEVLFYPKISILLKNNEKIKNYPEFFSKKVTFMLVHKPTRNQRNPEIKLVVDVMETPYSAYSNSYKAGIYNKREFFIKRGIAYRVYDVNKTGKYIINKEISCPTNLNNQNKITNAFNYSQYTAIMSFIPYDNNIEKNKEQVFIIHEPSLDMIVDVVYKSSKKLVDQINKEVYQMQKAGIEITEIPTDYLSQTSVDAVFCVDPPSAVPLFAIEYDGKEHYKNPKKQLKDKLKNMVFKEIKIPLIRVRSENFNELYNNPDLELKNKVNRLISRILIETLMENRNYAFMLVSFLREKAKNLGSNTQNGSSIRSLTEKLDRFISQREDRMALLNKSYEKQQAIISEQHKQYIDYTLGPEAREFNNDKKKSEYSEFTNRFGLPIEEIFDEDKYQWRAKLDLAGHRWKLDLPEFIESAAYKVEDASDVLKLQKVIKNFLLKDLRNKIDERFKLLFDKYKHSDLKKFIELTYNWYNHSPTARVPQLLDSENYFRIVGEIYCSSTSDKRDKYLKSESEYISSVQPLSKAYEHLLEIIKNPLFDIDSFEKEMAIQEITNIHEILTTKGKIFQLFIDKDFSPFSSYNFSEFNRALTINNEFNLVEIFANTDIFNKFRKNYYRK